MIRNSKTVQVPTFTGVDTWVSTSEAPPSAMVDALNVVVTPNGNVMPLRSPANVNTALATGNKVISASEYTRAAGAVVIFDINDSSGANVHTYATSGGANTSVRTAQANARWQSLNVNDALFRVNGTETIQIASSFAVYTVGITAPASVPTVATSVGGGTLTLNVGVTSSYAYRRSAGNIPHVGEASGVSASSGVLSLGALKVTTVASAAAGVDGIVLFLPEDGGSVRYLVCDANGDPIVYANASATIAISADYNLNLNVQESSFNSPPPAGSTFLFKWKERVAYCNGRFIYYSGWDQIQIGSPYETVPALNAIAIPSKAEIAKCGIDTQVGALILSDRDAYLAQGSPTDKIDSGVNTLQPTETMRQLRWGLGTRSPLTLVNCPWGTIWLDQNKHLQFWAWQGTPEPLATGIWEDLDTIADSDTSLALAEAKWFSLGKNAGFYVLTALAGEALNNNRMWLVMIHKQGGQLVVAPSISDIAAQCIAPALLASRVRCFIGVTDRLREILDFETQGAGWADGTQIYFDFVAGNQETRFNYLHVLGIDGVRAQDALIRVGDIDDTSTETVQMFEEDGSYFGRVERDGVRHRVSVNFPADDLYQRDVQIVHLVYGLKRRSI